MKHCFFISLLFLSLIVRGQKTMYLYFETESKTPFYLKLDDKIYSSLAPGYFVLPSLAPGKHFLTLGVPSENRKENRFEIDLRDRDRGFRIFNREEGLILEDMQDGARIPFRKDPSQPDIVYESRNDPFTLLLSKASGDPGLLMMPVFAKAEVKAPKKEVPVVAAQPLQETAKEVVIPAKTEELTGKDSPVVVVQPVIPEEKPSTAAKENLEKKEEAEASSAGSETALPLKEALVAEPKQEAKAVDLNQDEATAEYSRSLVQKFAESSTSEGFNLVFIDDREGVRDTIRLIIPNPRYNIVNADPVNREDDQFLRLKKEKELALEKKRVPDSTVKGRAEASPLTRPVADQDGNARIDTDTIMVAKSSLPLARNACRNTASENDFFKLRKNMAARITDEEMVTEARKAFRAKCYTAEQIKNLGSLFLTSAGKYLFFDAAFPNVSDPENFAGLETEIKDDYYRKRFKALIGE